MTNSRLRINSDGASRGNPGQSAIGATVKDEQGRLVASVSRTIGRATNNQAEYRALIAALEKAAELGAQRVDVCLDAELVVRQLQGRYRVKSAALRPLYLRAAGLLGKFEAFTIAAVPRTENAEADHLANQALDRD
ncbi:MAG: ribonuclease HI family protein [Dehalococcoidales bacterium]